MPTAATISGWSFRLGSAASPQVLTSIGEVTNVSGLGVTNNLVPVTNFDSASGVVEYISGLSDGAEFTVEANYVAGNAGQLIGYAAVDAQATRLFDMTFTGASPNRVWSGSVVCIGHETVPSVDAQNTVTFTFKITGTLTSPTT